MSTVQYNKREEITAKNKLFSQVRTTIETAFYGNNVVKVNSLKEAYNLAYNSPGTIITSQCVYRGEELGLDSNARVLLFNDGNVKGRCAAAKKVLGEVDVNSEEYSGKIREAIFLTRGKKLYHGEVIIGLQEDFMVKAHLLIPEGHENILYNWMLNFQYINEEYINMYRKSKRIEGEGDIYIFSDPEWKNSEHPYGLAFFDSEHNVSSILGMRYFGEHKKGTLTLAWGCANRHGYVSCHGGQKRYNLSKDRKFVAGVFGLSGSGKSTITHAKHDGKYDITVLHDDAFIISMENSSSVALEPAYFDKTQDYPLTSEDNKYLLTVQNCGATVDEEGRIVLVTEDIRNGNGRAVKSKIWSDNRTDKLEEPVNAIFWLMKDQTLPPVLKVKGASLASTLGATLATKRTSAERLVPGIDPDALVIEPYANPFRTWKLEDDYNKFKVLFEKNNVDCYILNTGSFMDKKITKEVTLTIIENIVEANCDFTKWAKFSQLEIMEIEGYKPDFNDKNYKKQFEDRMKDRLVFLEDRKTAKGGYDALPEEALQSLRVIINEI